MENILRILKVVKKVKANDSVQDDVKKTVKYGFQSDSTRKLFTRFVATYVGFKPTEVGQEVIVEGPATSEAWQTIDRKAARLNFYGHDSADDSVNDARVIIEGAVGSSEWRAKAFKERINNSLTIRRIGGYNIELSASREILKSCLEYMYGFGTELSKLYISSIRDSIDDSVDDALTDEEIDKLIQEEEDAVASYEAALKVAVSPQAKDRLQHILEEEQEHIQELRSLKAQPTHDSEKDVYEIKNEMGHYVIYKNNIRFSSCDTFSEAVHDIKEDGGSI